MKKFLALFLIALFAFQAIHCQETEEENVNIEENPLVEDELEFNNEIGEFGEELEIGETENEVGEEVNTEEWAELDVEEFLADEETNRVFIFGAQFFVADRKGNGELNYKWVLQELHSVSHAIDEDGYDYYNLSLTLEKQNDSSATIPAEFVVKTSQDKPIKYEVLTYSTYSPDRIQDDEGNLVDALLKTSYVSYNGSYVQQYVKPETFEPISEPTSHNEWTPVTSDEFKGPDNIFVTAQNAAEAEIPKAQGEGTLVGGDWSVSLVYGFSVLPEIMGNTYYRFSFQLDDKSSKLLGFGYAYGIYNQADGFKYLTSGLSSLKERTVSPGGTA